MTLSKLVQPNLDYAETHRACLRQHHAGQWVLLHQGTLVAAFDTLHEAQRAAHTQGLAKHLILFVDRSLCCPE